MARYSCVYKKRVFALFPEDFFSIFFVRGIRGFLEKNFLGFIPPPFFGHDICVFIKKRVFALFPDDFFQSFLARDLRVFLEKKFSRVFFPHFFVTIFVCL